MAKASSVPLARLSKLTAGNYSADTRKRRKNASHKTTIAKISRARRLAAGAAAALATVLCSGFLNKRT